ncbi:hypothetical protein PROFUN_12704 [Planoprotostelium fungivorum]|uniref:Uncharacterized protein n=1 Tax=Planoprotostelium fungivorum TaxID=1890364 RepID=A0A2P6N6F0_9EUKA|nr:hypothetical protein PROFUN_12704 [Planoprotostelium fungivorum]
MPPKTSIVIEGQVAAEVVGYTHRYGPSKQPKAVSPSEILDYNMDWSVFYDNRAYKNCLKEDKILHNHIWSVEGSRVQYKEVKCGRYLDDLVCPFMEGSPIHLILDCLKAELRAFTPPIPFDDVSVTIYHIQEPSDGYEMPGTMCRDEDKGEWYIKFNAAHNIKQTQQCKFVEEKDVPPNLSTTPITSRQLKGYHFAPIDGKKSELKTLFSGANHVILISDDDKHELPNALVHLSTCLPNSAIYHDKCLSKDLNDFKFTHRHTLVIIDVDHTPAEICIPLSTKTSSPKGLTLGVVLYGGDIKHPESTGSHGLFFTTGCIEPSIDPTMVKRWFMGESMSLQELQMIARVAPKLESYHSNLSWIREFILSSTTGTHILKLIKATPGSGASTMLQWLGVELSKDPHTTVMNFSQQSFLWDKILLPFQGRTHHTVIITIDENNSEPPSGLHITGRLIVLIVDKYNGNEPNVTPYVQWKDIDCLQRFLRRYYPDSKVISEVAKRAREAVDNPFDRHFFSFVCAAEEDQHDAVAWKNQITCSSQWSLDVGSYASLWRTPFT